MVEFLGKEREETQLDQPLEDDEEVEED